MLRKPHPHQWDGGCVSVNGLTAAQTGRFTGHDGESEKAASPGGRAAVGETPFKLRSGHVSPPPRPSRGCYLADSPAGSSAESTLLVLTPHRRLSPASLSTQVPRPGRYFANTPGLTCCLPRSLPVCSQKI